jgi:DNA polymerase-3 subunit delta
MPKASMIIFLYGPDSFRSKEKLDEIIIHYKGAKKSGLNLVSLDAVKTPFAEFYNNFKVSSMFAETKLVVVKQLFSAKAFQEDFLKELLKLHEVKDIIVIYESEAPDERLKLFKELLKKAKCQEFELLDTKGIKTWAIGFLEKNSQKMNNDALDLLVSFVGDDLWRLSGELAKLASYKKDKVIQKTDVELLVTPKIETDIFKTIDALAEKNKTLALQLLHKHLDTDDNPLYLLSMICYQVRNLLVVKELAEKGLMYASIIKKSGLHPFVVKKTYFQCRQFSFGELKDLYRQLFAIDAGVKVGAIDAQTALDVLVSKI